MLLPAALVALGTSLHIEELETLVCHTECGHCSCLGQDFQCTVNPGTKTSS